MEKKTYTVSTDYFKDFPLFQCTATLCKYVSP